MHRIIRPLLLAAAALLAGCAFPQVKPGAAPADGLSAAEIFDASLAAHGGDIRDYPGDINLATDGRWYWLIQRIQPVVSDANFRVTSEERYRPRDGLYAVRHRGPAGVKYVLRSPEGVRVHYNGVAVEAGDERLRATAMTNDAFQMFHFGPSFFKHRASSMVRLADMREQGRSYYRLLATLIPGFGESDSDEAVLWIDSRTSRLYRIHMTLEGFETTRGAHVDTTFLAYRRVGPFLLPARFSERVRGPLRIKAHEWHVTRIDLDRGWTEADVSGPDLRGRAAGP